MNPVVSIEYWLLGAGVLLAAGSWMAWRSAARLPSRLRVIVTACRAGGLAVLAVLALNPGRWVSENRTNRSEWAIVVDRSASMRTADVDGTARSRVAAALAARAAALARAPERLRVYSFAAELEAGNGVEDVTGRPADGEATDIEHAAQSLLARYQAGDKRLSGVLLLSDGRHVLGDAHDDIWARARAQEAPFYTLTLGGAVERPDLSVTVPRRQIVAFTGQTARIAVRVSNARLGPIRPTLRLLDESGAAVAEQSVELADNSSRQVTFELQPPRAGYFAYSVVAAPWPGEIVSANNEARFGMTVLEGKLRLFLAEGAPFWDSKFLARMLSRQSSIEVASLYRLSAERFYEVRTGATNGEQVAQAVFPDDAAALAGYDLLVFGKGCEYFLTPERIERLKHYVRDQGGRVIFARGKPYAEQLPGLEALEPLAWGPVLPHEFHLRPRPEARDYGLFGDMLPGADDPVWSRLAPLRNAYQCAGVKAFTDVHADGVFEAAGREVAFPLVASRRYGRGLVVVVNAEGFWQWDFFPRQQELGRLYRELWLELFQWAVTRAEFLPGQTYSLSVGRSAVLPRTPVRVRIGRRDGRFERSTVPLRVWLDGRVVQEVAASGAADRPEREAVLTLVRSGLYRVTLADAPDVSATLQVLEPPREMDNVSADPEYMKRIAALSGGRAVGEAELPELVKQLEYEPERTDMSKAQWAPLWDNPLLCILVTALFAVEWFLRRRHGLI